MRIQIFFQLHAKTNTYMILRLSSPVSNSLYNSTWQSSNPISVSEQSILRARGQIVATNENDSNETRYSYIRGVRIVDTSGIGYSDARPNSQCVIFTSVKFSYFCFLTTFLQIEKISIENRNQF